MKQRASKSFKQKVATASLIKAKTPNSQSLGPNKACGLQQGQALQGYCLLFEPLTPGKFLFCPVISDWKNLIFRIL